MKYISDMFRSSPLLFFLLALMIIACISDCSGSCSINIESKQIEINKHKMSLRGP